MITKATLKQWGNSIGIILPKQTLKENKLSKDDEVIIEVHKEADLTDIFGTLKTKTSGQKFKDEVKEGWE